MFLPIFVIVRYDYFTGICARYYDVFSYDRYSALIIISKMYATEFAGGCLAAAVLILYSCFSVNWSERGC